MMWWWLCKARRARRVPLNYYLCTRFINYPFHLIYFPITINLTLCIIQWLLRHISRVIVFSREAIAHIILWHMTLGFFLGHIRVCNYFHLLKWKFSLSFAEFSVLLPQKHYTLNDSKMKDLFTHIKCIILMYI